LGLGERVGPSGRAIWITEAEVNAKVGDVEWIYLR